MNRLRFQLLFLLIICAFFLEGCQPSSPAAMREPSRTYAAQNVVLVVIDGVRYSDSWGDSAYTNIPFMAKQLAPQGLFHPAFYNQGVTLTMPGHVALTTGKYQRLSNRGSELPLYPSIFHYYRQHSKTAATDAWLITSKDKLEVLGKTYSQEEVATFSPSSNCGVNGLGSGYRADEETLKIAKQIFQEHTPRLSLINLHEPDTEAHRGNWDGYLAAIKKSDRLVHDLWNWLQQHPHYRNNTTFIITNDHGRHPGRRFTDHGDGCESCRHISLLMLGPDVPPGSRAKKPRTQADVAATVAELLGFPFPKRDGEPMLELFKEEPLVEKAK
ncbi:sulfatase-like hydrolase/transferase [Rufibacter sp. LB8]|uniref:sulfatase-like hydrolase/transferase n=1 Tax=Rufibacter sp. LB8 TaxID=2777781 RepID=UPI00178C3862|nr:sulfatase-like hydrolase/transferase [Rufibacter sp. LB8]